jgi:hypothetical protein
MRRPNQDAHGRLWAGRRSAASLDPDCFIAATATRIRGGWMSVPLAMGSR